MEDSGVERAIIFQLPYKQEKRFLVANIQVFPRIAGKNQLITDSININYSSTWELGTTKREYIALEYRNKIQMKLWALISKGLSIDHVIKQNSENEIVECANKFSESTQTAGINKRIGHIPELDLQNKKGRAVNKVYNYNLQTGSSLTITQISEIENCSTGIHLYQVTDSKTGKRYMVGYSFYQITNISGSADGFSVSSLSINIFPPFRRNSSKYPNIEFSAHQLFEISQVIIFLQFKPIIFLINEKTEINEPFLGERKQSMAFYLKRGFYPLKSIEAQNNANALLSKILRDFRIRDRDCVPALSATFTEFPDQEQLLWIAPVVPVIELGDNAEILKPIQADLASRFAFQKCGFVLDTQAASSIDFR